MLSLVFDAAGVAVFIVTILCFYNNNNNNNRCTYNAHNAAHSFSAGQALKTINYFLRQNQIRIQQKIVSVHPMDSDVGKL